MFSLNIYRLGLLLDTYNNSSARYITYLSTAINHQQREPWWLIGAGVSQLVRLLDQKWLELTSIYLSTDLGRLYFGYGS